MKTGVDTVSLALKVGAVPVRFANAFDGEPGWPMQGEMTQRDPEFGELLDRCDGREPDRA